MNWISPQTLRGSFSAVSKPNFATKYSFCSIFRDLQDWHPFAPLQTQFFCKKSSTILRNWMLNWTIIQSNFSSKLLFLSQILMKFCRNFANVLKNIRNRWHVQKFGKILRNFRKFSEKLCKNSILFNIIQSCPYCRLPTLMVSTALPPTCQPCRQR